MEKRINLLTRLYCNQKDLHSDIRHLNCTRDIDSRIETINALLACRKATHQLPKKRESYKMRTMKLKNEKNMLITKRTIYEKKESGAPLSGRSVMIERLLETSSRRAYNETHEESEINKMNHILILMCVYYSKYSEADLFDIVNKTCG